MEHRIESEQAAICETRLLVSDALDLIPRTIASPNESLPHGISRHVWQHIRANKVSLQALISVGPKLLRIASAECSKYAAPPSTIVKNP